MVLPVDPITAISGAVDSNGVDNFRLPSWGRCFWQDPNDGQLFLAYSSGLFEVDFITSNDGGRSWTAPEFLFPCDNFDIHNNFDVCMDRQGGLHCGFRWQGSGCYRFVGKASVSGGWTLASGAGPQGFNVAGDSGNVGGFNGSITIKENGAPFGDWSTFTYSYPAAVIVAKASGEVWGSAPINFRDVIGIYVTSYPYDQAPTIHEIMLNDIGGPTREPQTAGIDGGFPIAITHLALSTVGVSYYSKRKDNIFDPDGEEIFHWSGTLFKEGTPDSTSVGFQDLTGFRFGENGAIGSGAGPSLRGLVLHNDHLGQMFYSTVNTNPNFSTSVGWGSAYSFAQSGNPVQDPAITWLDTFATGVFKDLNTPLPSSLSPFAGAGERQNASGTNCDFTFTDVTNETIFYFQDRDHDGVQCIKRFSSLYTDGPNNGLFDESSGVYNWYALDNPASGIKIVARADTRHCGSVTARAHWRKFKALKHPIEPGDGFTKRELLVTSSYTPTVESGSMLTIWDIDNAVATNATYTVPIYQRRLTDSQADGGPFIAALSQGGMSSTGNLFDGSKFTDAGVSSAGGPGGGLGGFIVLAFEDTVMVTEVEVWKRGAQQHYGKLHILGSFDGVNFKEGYAGEQNASPFLENSTFQVGVTTARESNEFIVQKPRMTPVVGKFIRLEWRDNTFALLSEVFLFGNPGMTKFPYRPLESALFEYRELPFRPDPEEEFKNLHGSTPPGWLNRGDFKWLVEASGNFKNPSQLPGQQIDADGTVQSGTFEGDLIGLTDGFALTSIPTTVTIAGDVAQMDKEIELFAQDLPHTVSFYYRMDIHTNDTFVYQNVRDGQATTVFQFPVPNFPGDWAQFDHVIADTGVYTLRWLHARGATTDVGRAGHVWIDRVSGIPGPPNTSIYGYMAGFAEAASGAIHGVIRGSPFGQIHGYLHGFAFIGDSGSPPVPTGDQRIYGYMKSFFPNSSIHGFIGTTGDFDVEYIKGLLKGQIGDQFIHGYLKRPPAATESIHGYLAGAGFPSGSIHGYMVGVETPSGAIHGYMSGVPFDSESIHGYMFGVSGVPNESIHGYMMGDKIAPEAIHGTMIGRIPSGIDPCDHNIYPLPPASSGSAPSGATCNILV